jgi:hypothetical protein
MTGRIKVPTWIPRVAWLVVAAAAMMLTWTSRAQAYPWMIKHGYSGCNACHVDPSGGGLLTLYGRAQSETLLRMPYGRAADAEPGNEAQFLFGVVHLPDELLLGGDVRSLAIRVAPKGAPATNEYWLMQADAEGQVSIDRVHVSGSIGYAQRGALPAAMTHNDRHNLVSRLHWVGLDLDEDKQWMVRAGRMNLPFGLRIIEHTAWVRSATRTDTNQSQQHGVSLAYNGEGIRGEVMAIAGNFQVKPDDYRDRGYSAFAEWAPKSTLAIGVSSMIVHATIDLLAQTPVWRHAHGAFGRWSPWKPLVLLAEGDMLLRSQPPAGSQGATSALGYASMLQADVELIQGLHAMGTGESYNADTKSLDRSYAAWGTLAWFFAPHADMRGDVVWQSLPAGPGNRVTATILMGQLHVFL